MLSCCALQFHWNFVLGFFPHGIKFYTEPRKRGAWIYIALISVKFKRHIYLHQPIMRQTMMSELPEINVCIMSVCRHSPSQNIQEKLLTTAYCVITCSTWHHTWKGIPSFVSIDLLLIHAFDYTWSTMQMQ